MLKVLPDDRNRPYDTYALLEGILDRNSFTEYKREYGKTMITGYARIDGWSVGIVANQRNVVRSAAGEMQIGGVIYSDSADKAARFIKIGRASCRESMSNSAVAGGPEQDRRARKT